MNKSTFWMLGLGLSMILSSQAALAAKDDDKRKKASDDEPHLEEILEGLYAKADLGFGYTDNVFSTPTGEYEDPETKTLRTDSATSAMFLKPKMRLGYKHDFTKQHGLQTELNYDLLLFQGGGNVTNANTLDMDLHLSYLGTFGDHTIEAGYKQGNSNSLYLHKGTGATRLTRVGSIPEGQRYAYSFRGPFLSYSADLPHKIKVYVDYEDFHRDYSEVDTLQSYDRKETLFKVTYSQRFGKNMKIRANVSSLDMPYDTNLANDLVNGVNKSVAGVLQHLKEESKSVKFTYKEKDWAVKPYLELFSKLDLHADYWAYDETIVGVQGEYELDKRQTLTFDLSNASRQYKKELDPNGFLRDRSTVDFMIGWEMKYSKTRKSYLELSQFTQDDVDAYYSYKELKLSGGYVMEF